jgi:hypothetical protein
VSDLIVTVLVITTAVFIDQMLSWVAEEYMIESVLYGLPSIRSYQETYARISRGVLHRVLLRFGTHRPVAETSLLMGQGRRPCAHSSCSWC